MKKNNKARKLVGDSGGDRQEHDFYATKPSSVEALVANYMLSVGGLSVYEPCCGMGHVSDVLKKYFKKVKSTDLIYRGYGKKKSVDFLTKDFGKKKYDWVITNPPFKHAQEFIEKALSVSNVGVAMFLKIQFLEGVKRKDFFESKPPKYIYVFSARQPCLKEGLELNPETGKKWSSTVCYAWYVWEHGFDGEPTMRWI